MPGLTLRPVRAALPMRAVMLPFRLRMLRNARRRRIVRGVEDAVYCGVFLGAFGLCAALAEGLARLLGA